MRVPREQYAVWELGMASVQVSGTPAARGSLQPVNWGPLWHGDHCSMPVASTSRLPQKLAFMLERQPRVAGEKALIKNCSCPFQSSGLFSFLLYQLLPINVSFSGFV